MSGDAFVARQAIVDARQKLVAYELLFRTASGGGGVAVADGMAASFTVVTNALLDMGTKWLLGDKLAFVNMGTAALMSELPAILPPDKVVIEILEDVVATPALVARVQALRAQGFRFALDDYDHRPAAQPLLPLVSFVKLDVLALAPPQLAHITAAVRGHAVQLLAEKVETRAQYDACRAQGFELFQGYFFARPETFRTRVLSPVQATVLRLVERVGAGAEAREIEGVLRHDVALTVKLLQYVNSAGFGLGHHATSLRHVIAILGQRPLMRWLAVLLATTSEAAGAAPLARNAVVRGRLCELLGARALGRADAEPLFIAGVFSMLDALLEVPMQDVLARLAMPEAVALALAGKGGRYAPVLDLAVALEAQDVEVIAERAAVLGLAPDAVSADHLAAIAWAEQIGLD